MENSKKNGWDEEIEEREIKRVKRVGGGDDEEGEGEDQNQDQEHEHEYEHDHDPEHGPSFPHDHSSPQSSSSLPSPGLIELEKLEQIYNFSESDDDGELEDNLLPWQEEIIEEMEKSLEYSQNVLETSAGDALVNISKDDSSKIRTDLWKNGPIKFMDKYGIVDCEHPPEVVLAALGIRLPLPFVAKYSKQQLIPFLKLAIRHTLSSRQRLAYPHTLNDLCKVLETAKKIIVLTGAGISTSLGIPDFRSESGLYNKLTYLGLSDPQEVFDISLFREDPSIFYSVAKDILPETTRFSPTHAFIRLLQDKGILLRNYTQNIDNLESYAGIDKERLVQCHGSFATATCITCGYKTAGEEIFVEIRKENVPKCPVCTVRMEKEQPDDNSDSDDNGIHSKSEGVLKPDITFFGEALPNQFEELLLGGDAQDCDLLICIGTSLKVAPVSEIVRIIPPDIPQIYISKTAVHHNEFDITFLGSCDDAVELIVEKMGWELQHDMTRRHTLNARQIEGSNNLVFPDGKIIFEDEEAVYNFIND